MADEIRRDGEAVTTSQRSQHGDADLGESSERIAERRGELRGAPEPTSQRGMSDHRDPTGRDDTDARERQSRR